MNNPTVIQGAAITFTPSYRGGVAVSGIVQDVIHNDENQVGYHVFSPLPGDRARVVRVWERDGKIELN